MRLPWDGAPRRPDAEGSGERRGPTPRGGDPSSGDLEEIGLRFDAVSFGYRRGQSVLEGLDLSVPSGTTVLLGPNGAGKSTLLCLAAGVARPVRGEVRRREAAAQELLSSSRSARAYRAGVAWLPQDFRPLGGLTLSEHVAYSGWLKGMTPRDARRASGQALRRVGLEPLAPSSVRQLSGGQLRRLGIAGALVHDARLILLDEPGAGLDPLQRERLQEIIRELGEDRDVVVSTHQTEDVHGTFDHVVVLDAGRAVFQGSVTELERVSTGASRDSRDRLRDAYRNLVGREV